MVTALADDVVVTHLETSGLAGVLLVLALLTHGGELEDAIALAQACRPLDHHVRANHAARIDLDIGTDHTVRADLDVSGQTRSGIDDGGGMNQAIFLSAQMISPSQASSPSTLARQANFQMPRLPLITSASSLS